ncbi:hypothetical protein BJ684DRAFT_19917 [Piptocephalis cylindrospora]|uniref:Caspase domain-containing protein n=1 Tax=Piptocephalis cylindrospora TaxID=1907219 RepID=A0A4P9Y3S0_9FUNG|nr:hypothetical protein BJ684DRAFT_19917 [Piptocephalis cylindrospora]|eukprot:RKP13608.1 hypothetical protein BJ684DRAFT_19917 [Piptocephalis cylindrospora]
MRPSRKESLTGSEATDHFGGDGEQGISDGKEKSSRWSWKRLFGGKGKEKKRSSDPNESLDASGLSTASWSPTLKDSTSSAPTWSTLNTGSASTPLRSTFTERSDSRFEPSFTDDTFQSSDDTTTERNYHPRGCEIRTGNINRDEGLRTEKEREKDKDKNKENADWTRQESSTSNLSALEYRPGNQSTDSMERFLQVIRDANQRAPYDNVEDPGKYAEDDGVSPSHNLRKDTGESLSGSKFGELMKTYFGDDHIPKDIGYTRSPPTTIIISIHQISPTVPAIYIRQFNPTTALQSMAPTPALFHLRRAAPERSKSPSPPPEAMTPRSPGGGVRRALLVAVSYADIEKERQACLEAIRGTKELLHRFHYQSKDIYVLTNAVEGQGPSPTRRSILQSLAALVGGIQPGDRLVFFFHGRSQQTEGAGYNVTGKMMECILPQDYQRNGYIDDKMLYEALAQPLPRRARLTCLFNSVHDACPLGLGIVLDHNGQEIGTRPRHRGRQERRSIFKARLAFLRQKSEAQLNEERSRPGARRVRGGPPTSPSPAPIIRRTSAHVIVLSSYVHARERH